MKAQRTRSQEKVLEVLQSLKKAISAQELYIELRQSSHNMGLATVYRSLEALKLQGEIKVRILPNGESVYSSVQRDQHRGQEHTRAGRSCPGFRGRLQTLRRPDSRGWRDRSAVVRHRQ